MRQNQSRFIDSANRNRRGRRGGSQDRSEKSNQTQSRTFSNLHSIRRQNSQTSKKENSNEEIRNHFESILNCLKTTKKKQFLLKLAGIESKPLCDRMKVQETTNQPIFTVHKSFISDFFFDTPSQEYSKPLLNSQKGNNSSKDSIEPRMGKKIGHSYCSIQPTPTYKGKKAHFVDFTCNSLYKVKEFGGEGENKKVNDSNDLSPQPAELANSTLSENIDMHSIKVIKYNRLFLDFLDPQRKVKFAKSHQMNNDEDILNYIVEKKIHLDELLQDIEDDKRFISRTPVNLCLNDPNLLLPSFKFSDLHFLYYVIVLIESRTSLTPHSRRPISKCFKHLIPILLAVSEPVITPFKRTEYYQTIKSKLIDHHSKVLTSLSPFTDPSLFDQKMKELLSFSPQFTFTEREWPCHLLLPPLFIRYMIILFDLLSRLDEYLQEIPFISFRSSFGLNDAVRADLTLDYLPSEFKRLFESIEKGGSLTQKLYDLRNISYQIISVNGLNILDRELQIIESFAKSCMNPNHNSNHVLTEELLLEKMRHDIVDQNSYKVKFIFDDSGEEMGFNFQMADLEKLHLSRKFDETYVFPNYSINTLQPKNDPTLVKYDGVLKSNMTFQVSGSSEPSDDQFHVQFTDDSYGIIINYTNLV